MENIQYNNYVHEGKISDGYIEYWNLEIGYI